MRTRRSTPAPAPKEHASSAWRLCICWLISTAACSEVTPVQPALYAGVASGHRYQLAVRRVEFTEPDPKGRTQVLNLLLRFEGLRFSVSETASLPGGLGLDSTPHRFHFVYGPSSAFEWAEFQGALPTDEAIGANYCTHLGILTPARGLANPVVLEHTYQPDELPLEIWDP